MVLLHPSPNTSKLMVPLAMKLSKNYTVLCPDTPGYGDSAGLKIPEPSMKDYAEAIKRWLNELGITKCDIYGTATGAQIAIRVGLEYPDLVGHLYLDNCAHFDTTERNKILNHYFPDLTPQLDGSHLEKIWDIVYNLFQYFPWCFKEEQYKLKGNAPSPQVLHAIALDYMIAGKQYDLAYRAAFMHEKVDYIKALQVATTIIRWQGSILKKYTDRIFEHSLPDYVRGVSIPVDPSTRYDHIAALMKENIPENSNQSIAIEEAQKVTESPEYVSTSSVPPNPESDGSHLKEAWQTLLEEFNLQTIDSTEETAEEIQQRLIRWYQ